MEKDDDGFGTASVASVTHCDIAPALVMSSYFGDEGDFVLWSSAQMIGKGSFSLVYRARLKNVRE